MNKFHSIAFKIAFPLFLAVVIVSVISVSSIYYLQTKQLNKDVALSGHAILDSFVKSTQDSLSKGQRKTFQSIVNNTASLEGVVETSLYDRKGLKLYKSGEVTIGKPFVHEKNGIFKNPNKELYEKTNGMHIREDWFLNDVENSKKALKHQEEEKAKGNKCAKCHFTLDKEINFTKNGKADVVTGNISHYYAKIPIVGDCVKCHTHWIEGESAGTLSISIDNSAQISRVNAMIYEFILAFVITAVIIIMLIIFFVNKVKKRLNQLDHGVQDLIKGHADAVEIEDNDEIGKISSSFNSYLESIKIGQQKDEEFIKDITELAKNVKNGNLTCRIDSKANNPKLCELKKVLNEMLDTLEGNIGRDINKIMEVIRQYASMDYRNRIENAVGELENTVNSLGDDITKGLKINLHNADTLQADSTLLSESIDMLNKSSMEQSKSIVETSATMDQMSVAINGLSSRTAQIVNQSQEIKSVVSIINDIAEQTNLLALNAAIEAARAGEHGRGFAVVADEVRKLAEKTQKSLAEINATINVLVQSISDAGSDIEEQAKGIEHVNGEINNLEHMIQENAKAASATSAVTDKLSELSIAIIHEVNKNKINK